VSDDAPKTGNPKRPRRRGWRIFFSIFKWTRVALLLALLSLIVLGIYVNRAGLPEWAHRRLVAELREKGWDAQFSRLRLRWYRGIVADQLQLSRTNTYAGPHLFVDTAEFRLNGKALRSFEVRADSVFLSGGRLIWPLPGTNSPRQTFVLNKVRGELLFKPDDQWELRYLQGQSLGAQVRIRGDITNASLIRDWKLPKKKSREPLGPEGEFWHEFLLQADKVRAVVPPELVVGFSLDARDPRSFEATAKLIAPGVESPWGAATNLHLTVRVLPPARSNDAMHAELLLSAGQPRTPWGAATNLLLDARLEPSLTGPVPTNGTARLELRAVRSPWGDCARLTLDASIAPVITNLAARQTHVTLEADELRTQWGMARMARVTARASHPATNLLPAAVQADAVLEQARTRWATSAWTRAETSLELPGAGHWLLGRTNLAWPERLGNIPIDLALVSSNVIGARMQVAHAWLTNRWQPPQLVFDGYLQTAAGSLAANATLDTGSRRAGFNATLRGDPHALAALLPTNTQPWLADYQSAAPIEIQAAGGATLTGFDPRHPNWRTDTLSTLSIAGRIATGAGAYHDVRFSDARALCRFSNSVWNLPEFRIGRPEGTVEGDAEIDGRTGEFRVKLASMIDPQVLRPAFSLRDQREIFEPFQFTIPPLVRGEVRGNFHDWSKLNATAATAVTNVTYQKQFVRLAKVRASFTNGFLSLYQPLILRDGERGEAEGIGIDVARERLYLTNAFGNLAPMAVAHAIGPQIVRTLKPFVFDAPPQVRVHGEIPTGPSDGSEDLRFEIDGGAFHWWKLHTDRARASIHWKGQYLILTNLQAHWHGSDPKGWLWIDFRQPKGGSLKLYVALAGADLHRAVQDFQDRRANRLEGVFGGELSITDGSVNDSKTWDGFGHVELKEGLLWDIPVIGIVSPMLNTIVPGLGNVRAKDAKATFTITNGVIYSKDLEIHATAMHLKYRGTIDFEGNIDARMEAQLLKGVPFFGEILRVVLWPVGKLFEYRVTRTLNDPKLDEVYVIPKLLLFPLQPIKTLKDVFGEEEKKPREKPPKKSP